MKEVRVTISGNKHSGKTNLAVLIVRMLRTHGIQATLPDDPQITEKVGQSSEVLAARLDDWKVAVSLEELDTTFP